MHEFKKRVIERLLEIYYNLDMVISVVYRTDSDRAIQFRRWTTYILKEFSKKGYIIDKKRMKRKSQNFKKVFQQSELTGVRACFLLYLVNTNALRVNG